MPEKKYLIDNPTLMAEWDWEKNNELIPTDVLPNSNKKVWWKCKNKHEWQATICGRTAGRNCPYCANRRVLIGYNDLATTAPEVAKEWNYEKNKNLSPLQVTSGSNKKVWWKCTQCKHEWSTIIQQRTMRNSNCPICSIQKRVVARQKTFLKKNGGITNQLLLNEWDYEKNDELIPGQFTPNSNKKIWWKCEKGHEWQTTINDRTSGAKCPYCSNRRVLIGYNDLVTTAPEIAKEWNFKKNKFLLPENVTIGSGKKVWWICPMGHEYQASVMHRGHGTNCPICNSGRQTSFAEQAVYYYVKQMYADTINRATGVLGNRMELDIYIPSIHCAIEYDGSFWHKKLKAQKREEEKYIKCIENGIKLIRIREVKKDETSCINSFSGCTRQYSSIKADYILYICENYKKEDLDILIWQLLNQLEDRAYDFISIPLYNSLSRISINVKRDETKIRTYMQSVKSNSLAVLRPDIAREWHPQKNGTLSAQMFSLGSDYQAWWQCISCQFEWRASIAHRASGTGCPQCYRKSLKEKHPNDKVVYQYSIAGNFIQKWRSSAEAGRMLNINHSNISMCAKHARTKAGGYRWEYTYYEYLEPLVEKRAKSILQMDDSGLIIKEFNSLNEASELLNIDPTNISKALHGHVKHAGGFCWRFKDSI